MDIGYGQKFETDVFFSGGRGMFLQYHDVVKPVYLWAIIKMILNKDRYDLPLNMISDMKTMSLIEWYIKRRYQNPLYCIDYLNKYTHDELDKMLLDVLEEDASLYRLCPKLNIAKMLSVYKKQHMTFPIFIYTTFRETYLEKHMGEIFQGVTCRYLYGDLTKAISKCDQNYTFMVSDIELYRQMAEILIGTCSHMILARDYRYNFKDNYKTMKYDLYDLAATHPFLKMESNLVTNPNVLAIEAEKILLTYSGGEGYASN